jgi:hypothetical protein
MFIKKKSFYQKKAFYIAVVAVMVLGIMINQIPGSTTGENINANNANAGHTADAAEDTAQNDTLPERPKPVENTGSIMDAADAGVISEVPAPSGYYLVKEVDGIIKVFYYDAQGRESVLQNTNILFSMISESDQSLFTRGVILDTEDELINLLQDFES